MKLPAVSVVFVSYKQERYVKEALLGALNQDLPAYELIIADDASPDGTVAVIESVLAANPRPHVSIRLIKHEKNLGLVNNFNFALAEATGDIFVMMAGDDVSYSARARVMAEAFAGNPKIRAVNCATRLIDAEGAPLPSRPHSQKSQIFEYGRGRNHIYANAPVTGASATYHRSIRDVFGPLSPHAGAEDADSFYRSLLLGCVLYHGEVLVDYRMHGANVSNFDMRKLTDAEILEREAAWSDLVAKNNALWMRDLELARKGGHIDEKRYPLVAGLVRKAIARHELTALSLRNAPRSIWLPAAWRLIKSGGVVKAASLFFMWATECRKHSHVSRVKRRKLQ
jgi:glycosyltransferase involved in cell wall biosynthesis